MGSLTRHRLDLLRQVLHGLDGETWVRVTSRDLARWVGTTPEIIRKDLSGAGAGTPGAAYELGDLLERLDRLVPLPPRRKTVLAGLGELGLALAQGNGAGPWALVAGFDGRPNRLETVEVPFPVFPTTEIIPVCLRLGIESAILALGPLETQKVAERFIQAGVRHLVNYSAAVLRVDRNRVEVHEFGGNR